MNSDVGEVATGILRMQKRTATTPTQTWNPVAVTTRSRPVGLIQPD